MKMHKITVISLVVASLVVADANAAWSRAGEFAHKVFVSKTGAAAGIIGIGYATWFGRQANLVGDELVKEPADFSENVHKEMQHFLENRGVRNCRFVFGGGPCAFKYKNEAYISFPNSYKSLFGVERQLPRSHEEVRVFNFIKLPMSECDVILEEAMAATDHEVSHLVHNDGLRRYVCTVALPSISLLMGKVMSVAGKNRLVAASSCLVTGIGGRYLNSVWERCEEKRCDLAASSSKSALHAANFFEKIKKKQDFYMIEEKKGVMSAVWLKLTKTHPDIDIRIAYLQKHAVQLKAAETEGVKTSFQQSIDALKAATLKDQYELYNKELQQLAVAVKDAEMNDQCDELCSQQRKLKTLVGYWEALVEENQALVDQEMAQKHMTFLERVQECCDIVERVKEQREAAMQEKIKREYKRLLEQSGCLIHSFNELKRNGATIHQGTNELEQLVEVKNELTDFRWDCTDEAIKKEITEALEAIEETIR